LWTPRGRTNDRSRHDLSEALAYPIIEGSNIGIRRRQLQDLFRTPGYNPLSASGMA
jgi:butyryl-CoA dehydrogenase